jgi:gliding motility-associated lipoprotein GldH
MRTKVFQFIPLFVSFFLLSCGNDILMIDKIEFKDEAWTIQDSGDFEIIIHDTVPRYELLYLIRNNHDYPYYNLYLTYFLEDDNGTLLGKKLQEIHLMNAKTGEPLGRGFGGVYDHKIIALPNLKFERPGNYRFSVKHYMRIDTLPGILSFGIQVNQKEPQ